VAVLNRALIRIGAQTIANLDTEQSREAEACRVLFEEELRSCLKDYPWAFATKYDAAVQIVRGPARSNSNVQSWSSGVGYAIGDVVRVASVDYYAVLANANQLPPNATFWSTTPVKANDDWTYAYRAPADAVGVRRLINVSGSVAGLVIPPGAFDQSGGPGGRQFERQPVQFRMGEDVNGTLIFTHDPYASIEYTTRLPCCVSRADELFRDAFAWRMAASLAPSLAQVDPDAVEQHGRGPQDRPRERKVTEAQLRERAALAAWRMYYSTIEKARRQDAAEQQQDPNQGDADWILGRE
jgi:hypothetical protein